MRMFGLSFFSSGHTEKKPVTEIEKKYFQTTGLVLCEDIRVDCSVMEVFCLYFCSSLLWHILGGFRYLQKIGLHHKSWNNSSYL